jgi:hypothetical protein
MKATLLLCLATLISASAFAGQIGYPEKNPLVNFTVPDDWKADFKHGSLFVVSPDGGDVIVELMSMEAAIDDDAAAVKEAKGTVNQDFKKLKLTKSDPTESNGLIITLLGGEGTDKSGEAHINMALIKHPKAETQILFSLIASKENAAKYGEACGTMMNSIAATKSAKPKSKDAVQTYSYPDKDKPDFAMDFPADWKLKDTDQGVYVESPDKLVAMNVIMVDKAEVKDAEKALKKSISDRFKEIEWNQGKEPEVNKDEALGLTATFQNAQASDGEGTEKYSVNLITYVRKSGDKSLIFLTQNPLRALDKHADAMQAVVRSIKVR